jgi:hypothetical protein
MKEFVSKYKSGYIKGKEKKLLTNKLAQRHSGQKS